jgi:hypothetical protein
MVDRPTAPNVWQYHLIWTPGSSSSVMQLWAATRMGTRNLWDSWEVPGHVGIPTVPEVLSALHAGAVELHERHSHLA